MSGSAEDSSDERMSERVIYRLLAHPFRKALLTCLLRHDEPLPLPDLADEVAVSEYETPLSEIPAEGVRDIYMMLYHNHVPRLEDRGIVQYDQGRDMVFLTENAEQIIPYLDAEEFGDRPF